MNDFFDMSSVLTSEQMEMRESLQKLCVNYGDEYWLDRDRTGDFPEDFVQTLADNGWLGLNTPVEYGGSGLGITEGAVLTQTISESGGGIAALSSSSHPIFGLNPVIKFGRPDQIERMVPPVIQRKEITCFGVTEPNTGLDTTKLKTRAERVGDKYIVNGQKIWTSTAQHATKILLIARTTPIEKTKRPIDGLSLFYTDFNRDYIEVRKIDKMGRKASDSNEVFFDGLPVPADDLIGEEGKAFYAMGDFLVTARAHTAARAIGLAQGALDDALAYVKERAQFGRPIGDFQINRFKLAKMATEIEAARQLNYSVCTKIDEGGRCDKEAGMSKYFASEMAERVTSEALQIFGGAGFTSLHAIERYWRDAKLTKIFEGTSEIQLRIISDHLLGKSKFE